MPTTANYSLRYPSSAYGVRVHEDMQNLAEDVDTALLAQPKPVKRARRTSDSTVSVSGSTALVGVLRLDNIAMTAGHLYEVRTSPMRVDAATDGHESYTEFRYSTVGAATTASTQLPGSRVDYRQADANVPEGRSLIITYTPGSDQTMSLLLCFAAVTGGGASDRYIRADGTSFITEFTVYDCGVDPGDTGVDV